MNLEKLLFKSGIFVIIFSVVEVVVFVLVWLFLDAPGRVAWQGFITSFALPVTIALVGAIGVSKWIDKFVVRK